MVPWLRNSMEILSNMYNVKGYDEISINRLSAIVADCLNQFTVDRIDIRFPSMVISPLQYTNIDVYDLNDE
jgi:hypothetical protein